MDAPTKQLWTVMHGGLPDGADPELIGRLECHSCGAQHPTGIYFPGYSLALCSGCYDTMDADYKLKLGGPATAPAPDKPRSH